MDVVQLLREERVPEVMSGEHLEAGDPPPGPFRHFLEYFRVSRSEPSEELVASRHFQDADVLVRTRILLGRDTRSIVKFGGEHAFFAKGRVNAVVVWFERHKFVERFCLILHTHTTNEGSGEG